MREGRGSSPSLAQRFRSGLALGGSQATLAPRQDSPSVTSAPGSPIVVPITAAGALPSMGSWSEGLIRGILLPVAGAGVEIALDPSGCRREATEAVAVLDEYNAQLVTAAVPSDLASPSVDNCKWCPFKLFCNPFWEAATGRVVGTTGRSRRRGCTR